MGTSAYASKRVIQTEYVPIILVMLYKFLSKKKAADAISLLNNLGISNDMMKEHLLDLCMNKNTKEMFDKLPTG